MSCSRIRDWINKYGEDGVYISFSGGKDSTVLMDLVRNRCGYEDVKAMFVDIPTQFPELRHFVEKYDNVDIVTPKYNFFEVCEKYGFPLISKEVSECVYGARKYLTSLQEEGTVLTDRQTDRQSSSSSKKKPYSSSYRKICGIGEYSRPSSSKQDGRGESEAGTGDGMVHKGWNDKGEYPQQG